MYKRLISGIVAFVMAFGLCTETSYASESSDTAGMKMYGYTLEVREGNSELPVGNADGGMESGHAPGELENESDSVAGIESVTETETGNAAKTESAAETGSMTETESVTEAERVTETESATETETETEQKTENESETGSESAGTIEIETEAENVTEGKTEIKSDDLVISNDGDSEEETDAVEEGDSDFLFQAGGFRVLNEDEGYAGGISLFSTGDIDQLADSIYTALKAKETSISVKDYGFYWDSTEDRQQLLGIYYAVVNDHPDLYYVRTGYGVSYQTNSKLITKISPQYFQNIDDEAFQDGVQEAKAAVTEDMDDLQKAIAIHDYIVLNCEYDKERLADKTIPKESYGAYGVLANRIAVCQGYALAYKYLLNEYGIECYIVTSDTMNHAWNIVRIGDELYQVDATWDDPTWDRYGLVSHSNMFLSDSEFGKNHRDWYVTKGSGIVDIKAEGTAYDDAFWRDVKSPLVRDYSESQKYYYVSGDQELQSRTCSIDQIDQEPVTLKNLDTPYSGLALDGTRLYYNTNKNISYIDISEAREDSTAEYQEQVRFSLNDGGTDNIYGFTRRNSIIRYVKRAGYALSGKSEVYTLDDSKDIVSETEGNTYTVTFQDDFGTVFDTQTIAEGGYAAPPDNKITFPAGYQLSYWKGNYSNVRKDETVSAVYTKISYKISYVLNGGTNSSANKATKYDVETDTIRLEPPTREHYDFSGWYQDSGYRTLITEIPKGSTGNLTLYAKWTPVTYRITYELNNGMNHPENPAEYNIESAGIVFGEPTREYYDFVSWYEDAAYQTKITGIEKGSTGERILYAKWIPTTYHITYELNGGTNNALNPQIYDVETDDITLKKPTREYHDFVGWYEDAAYQTPISVVRQGSGGDRTLYAKWALRKYTVSYELYGGVNSALNPSMYSGEADTIRLEAPTHEDGHCRFEGWYTDKEFTQEISSIDRGSAGDLCLYAKWVRYYRVRFFDTSNKLVSETEVREGADAMAPDVDIPVGYELQGWDKDYTNVSSDLDIKAVLVPRQYAITYVLRDGVNAVENPSTYTIETGTFQLGVPTHLKEELTFAGWYLDEKYQNRISSVERGSMGDLTLYARWVGVWVDVGESSENAAKTYTGNAVAFDRITVYNGFDELRQGTDYTVSYVNNVNAADRTADKAPAVVVTGKGNYEGKYTKSFTISPVEIGQNVNVAEMAAAYRKGKVQKPVPAVVWNGKKLVNNKDFTVFYQDSPVDVGEYEVVVTGKGNFTGVITTKLTITDNTEKIAMGSVKVAKKIPTQEYSPDGVTIQENMITLKYGAAELVAGTDYEFVERTYKDAGTHYVTIRGTGDKYIGEITAAFNIKGTSVSQLKADSVIYTGKAEKPVIKDKSGRQLTEGVDYVINSLSGSESAGTARISITGINAYYGTAVKSYKVKACPVDDSRITAAFAKNADTQPYEKNGASPKVVLTYGGRILIEGTDYSLRYKNNKAIGSTATVTITGKKNFSAKRTLSFTVGRGSLQNTTVTVADKVVSSKAGGYVSIPVVKDSNGNKLAAGKDYDKNIVYQCDGWELDKKADRLLAGAVVTVTISGKGNYEGTSTTATYRILAAGKDISKAKVTVRNKFYYDGSSILLSPDDLTVKIGKVTLSADDYEILPETYVNNDRKGTARVTIRGTGAYGGAKTISFKINAQKMGR